MGRITRRLAKLAPLLIGVALLVSMLIVFNLDNATLHKELTTLYLLPQPEKLTELYFDANAGLPKSATEKQTIRFAFIVHNLETIDYQYVYDVIVKSPGTSQTVDSGKILVKNGQYYSKTEQFSLKKASPDQEVVVELINKKLSIDFWIGK